MLRIALTGGIATGKSHILRLFAAKLVPTIDADRLAREVVKSGQPAWKEVHRYFGSKVFTSEGELDRKLLATEVFANPSARSELENIIHPYVRHAIDSWFQKIAHKGNKAFAIADIALLFETNRASVFDRVIVTSCDENTQLLRLMQRDNLSKKEASLRLDAQLDTAYKTARADFIIHTGGNFKENDDQVKKIYNKLNSSP
jgi:dephospho-CoA kinase